MTAEHPLHRLVELSLRERLADRAHNTLLRLIHEHKFPDLYDQEMIRRLRMAGLPVIANELIRLGFASDSIAVFQEALDLAAMPAVPSNVFARAALEFNPAQVREDLGKAINELNPAALAAIASRSIAAAVERRGRSVPERPGQRGRDTARATARRPQALDSPIRARAGDAAQSRR